MSYTSHLKSADNLLTTYEQTRAGFISLALERNRRATPHVKLARALKVTASKASAPSKLLGMKEIRLSLIAAAGISDKAAKHMSEENKDEAINNLIAKFLEPAGSAFVEELVYRFLLTRGDTLGGSMRNVGGALAQRKLTRAMISALAITGIRYRWLHSTSGQWSDMLDDDSDIELRLRGLSWHKKNKDRMIIFNLTVPIVKHNVDVCLLDCNEKELSGCRKKPESYLALGELKGGIDPAGADEHWKTASKAFDRIRKSFAAQHQSPKTFFLGASIQKKMASEIWSELEAGTLTNAANFSVPDQIASLCSWLISL
jgi:hypothetical protein